MTGLIVPAIIPQSEKDIETFLASLPGVSEIHVDVVDGAFVSNVSWPYTPVGSPQSVHTMLAAVTLEVDLMVAEPITAAYEWLAAGADMLVFHAETISVSDFKHMVNTCAVTIGIAASNDMPLTVLSEYVQMADYVQVMGIKDVGSQGQPLDQRVLARVAQIKEVAPQRFISIDGSVNAQTLPTILQTKADRYIVGSAIYGSNEPLESFRVLTNIVSTQG
jgi:ribulose-phosphate 3-epimerase